MIEEVFSLDEEYYYDDVDYIEEQIHKDTEVIYVADKVNKKHSNFINVDLLIENMQEQAHEDSGEWSESYLDTVTKEQKNEILNLLLEYMNKNMTQPSFFHVNNVREISVSEFRTHKKNIKAQRI